MTIGYSRNVKVSVSSGISKIPDPNPNVLCIFTHEENTFPYENGSFRDSTPVGKYWGTDSVTYQMVQAALSQNPGIKTGGGYVEVVKLKNSTSGKPSTIKTVDLKAKVEDIKAVTDGSISFSINGEVKKVIFVDFSSVNTVEDIAKLIDDRAFGFTVKGSNTTGMITFSTKIVGASITFINVAADTGVDLAGAAYLDMASATTTAGVDPTGETILEALTRLAGSVYFHGIATTKAMTEQEKIDTARGLFNQRYLFYPEITGMISAKEAGETITLEALWNTRLTTNLGEDTLEAKKVAVAACSKMFSSNYNLSNTALTMDNKVLAGVVGSDKITDVELDMLIARGVDVLAKRNATLSTLITGNANKYTDVCYLSNLIAMLLEINVFNVFLTDTKVSQTRAGRLKIKKAVEDVLDKLVRAGWLATGEEWNGDTFGNEGEFKESIRLNGYYIYFVEETTQADREKRTALLQIATKASGAYHGAENTVTLEE